MFPTLQGASADLPVKCCSQSERDTHDPPGLKLYNLPADSSESRDRSTTEPAVPQQLQQLLTDWKLRVRTEPMLSNTNFDKAVQAAR